jgi:hypothetical protein
VDNPLVILAVLSGVFLFLALLFYLMIRAVGLAKKASGAAHVLGAAMLLFGMGMAHDPAREVRIEMRRLRREDGDSGDPPDEESA